MARFDLHLAKRRPGFLLVVQSNFLDHLDSRVVVPLIPSAKAPPGARDLNPRFAIDGIDHTLFPQFLAAVPRRELGPVQGSLAAERDAITRALDLLLTGF